MNYLKVTFPPDTGGRTQYHNTQYKQQRPPGDIGSAKHPSDPGFCSEQVIDEREVSFVTLAPLNCLVWKKDDRNLIIIDMKITKILR